MDPGTSRPGGLRWALFEVWFEQSAAYWRESPDSSAGFSKVSDDFFGGWSNRPSRQMIANCSKRYVPEGRERVSLRLVVF